MSEKRKRQGPGRPRDPAKLEAILDGAYALFLRHGVPATTMEQVAERASVSKMTVYKNFPDKPALLAAVFERRIKTMHLPELLAVGEDLDVSLEHLAEFGEIIVSACNESEVRRMSRLMAQCADEYPRLAATFYTAGRGGTVKRLAAFLKSLTDRGFLSIEDPMLAAEQLFGSWMGLSEFRQNLGVGGPPSANAIAKHVRYAIDTMVRASLAGRGARNAGKARTPGAAKRAGRSGGG
jgi:TetR/AcrR family transcriptional regulator, mexJK operon transcriptional repressor